MLLLGLKNTKFVMIKTASMARDDVPGDSAFELFGSEIGRETCFVASGIRHCFWIDYGGRKRKWCDE